MSENEEKRPEVGKKLHDARVAKGYTLDDLQQATKIQKRYLIAIEDEKFDAAWRFLCSGICQTVC